MDKTMFDGAVNDLVEQAAGLNTVLGLYTQWTAE